MSSEPVWAQRIKQQRETRRWTQTKTVQKMRSVSASPLPHGLLDMWKRWERGKREPDEFHKKIIAATFETSVESLFNGTRSQTAENVDRGTAVHINDTDGLSGNGLTVSLLATSLALFTATAGSIIKRRGPSEQLTQDHLVDHTPDGQPDEQLKQEAHDERHPVKRRGFLTASGAAACDTLLSSRTRVLEALEIVTSGHADTLGIATDCLNELISHYSEKLSVSPLPAMYGDLLNVRSYAGDLLGRSGASARQRPDLIVAAGRLSNLLAVATSYMGDHESALIWCVDAERRSYESGYSDIAGWSALTRAMIAYYQGRANRSIDLAIDGQEIAPIGTVVHAKLAAHEMRARAMLGDTEGMARAKSRAAKAIAHLPSDVATTGVFSIALSEDPPYTATSLLLLSRFQDSASATRSVIQAAYPTGTRNRNRQSSSYSRTLLILGLAEAGMGNVDEAVAAGRAALDSSGLVWPTLVLAGKLDRALMRDYGDTTEVADYRNLYLDMTARTSSESHPARLQHQRNNE